MTDRAGAHAGSRRGASATAHAHRGSAQHWPHRGLALVVTVTLVALVGLVAVASFALGTDAPAPAGPPRYLSVVSPASATWGPTRDEIALAAAYVDDMTLGQQAGQVIVASYRGTGAPVELVRRLHLGGVIALGSNVRSPDQISAVNARLAKVYAGRGYPGFLAVDQEGGTVERVKGSATRFPTFMATGAADRPELTRRVAAASGGETVGLGFTVVLGPVADVTIGDRDPVIGTRSAGGSPALVSRQVRAWVGGLEDAGLVPVVKHFPGHGSVTTDSHVGLPVQRKSEKQLLTSDLVPFVDVIRDGAPAVMTGHVDVRRIDPHVPSSLSAKVTTGLLRERLGFSGLVVTDALSMTAVSQRYPGPKAAVRALQAGADVLLKPKDPATARAGIVRAVRNHTLSRDRLTQAATRMIATLIHSRASTPRPLRPGAGAATSLELSRAAVTSVAGPCSGRLVARRVRVYGPGSLTAMVRHYGRAAGLTFGAGRKVVLVPHGGGAPVQADVVVALDRPSVLGRTKARVRLATYGETPGSMRALVDVLVGRAPAPGRLPLAVPGAPRRGC